MISEVSMCDMMRSAARPMRRSCSGDRTSMTSDRTWATCPGAAAARVWKPSSVRMAMVNRPSATPSGVGMGRQPPEFLRPGTTLVSTIDGLGELRNPLVAGPGFPHQGGDG